MKEWIGVRSQTALELPEFPRKKSAKLNPRNFGIFQRDISQEHPHISEVFYAVSRI